MDIETNSIIEYFATLGFAEVDIEDGLTALCYEETPDSEYSLITDEEGSVPESLAVPLMLACYSPKGAFLWSTGFKNADHFKEIWTPGKTYAEKLQLLQIYRKSVTIEGLPF